MNFEILLRPEAELDITESYRWYESQVEGLGDEFLRAVDAAINLIERNPEAFSRVHKDVRRVLLRKFPYALFYFIEVERIIVLGCFHARRNPRQWLNRT